MYRLREMADMDRRRSATCEKGMSIIELLIAMTVLTVGMLGAMVMILTGMQSNSRSRNDTSAVVLNQEILEKFATLKNYPKTGTTNIYDCALNGSNLHLASLVQAPNPGAGAILFTAGTAPTPVQVGDIDWTQPTPAMATATTAGYAMQYRTCNNDIYEVRWNVMEVSPNPSSRISLLTVSSRQLAAQSGRNGMLFAVPTTLRTLIEN
jgi:prepilin-type N-terminal cleavage/methylation domain-containing protein